MIFAAPRFRQHFLTDQEAELDADAGKTDALTAYLGARGDIVKTGQIPALHTRAVVDHRHGAFGGVASTRDRRRAGVERVGHGRQIRSARRLPDVVPFVSAHSFLRTGA